MNLQENYKRLFKGRPASNDGSILFEARYNIKVKKHRINPQNYKGIDSALVHYSGTIDGPDIPKGTTFGARGVAGDVDEVKQLDPGTDMSLTISLFFPGAYFGFRIYHANDAFNENGDYSEDGWDEDYPLAFTAKAKQDEVSKMIDDAVVKYALSKGLEDHVAKKDGGTLDLNAFKNLKKRKRKPALDKDALADVVMTIADDAGGGRDMTDDIIDELGDFYDAVQKSRNKKLIDAYDDLRSTADGEPNEQAEAANKLLDVIG